jgi:hypothetical protein
MDGWMDEKKLIDKKKKRSGFLDGFISTDPIIELNWHSMEKLTTRID